MVVFGKFGELDIVHQTEPSKLLIIAMINEIFMFSVMSDFYSKGGLYSWTI